MKKNHQSMILVLLVGAGLGYGGYQARQDWLVVPLQERTEEIDKLEKGIENGKAGCDRVRGARRAFAYLRFGYRPADKDANLLDVLEMPALINEEPDVQAVEPAKEITQLFEGIVGNIQRVLLTFAILIVVVAGIGMMVSIYNSMSDRRHEIAVMRALGARRRTVLIVILLESILLSLGGGAFGVFLGHGLIGLLGPSISEHTGVAVNALAILPTELILIPGLIVLASAVGFLPAMVAYRTDVAQSLTANP